MKSPSEQMRYSHTWGSKPWIGALLLPFALFIANSAIDESWLLRLLVWLVALVLGMVALGSFISTAVQVDSVGELCLQTRLLGLPVSTFRLGPGAVHQVEVNAHASGGHGHGGAGSVYFNLELKHDNGRRLVTSGSDNGAIGIQAEALAKALNCPVKTTGPWRDTGAG